MKRAIFPGKNCVLAEEAGRKMDQLSLLIFFSLSFAQHTVFSVLNNCFCSKCVVAYLLQQLCTFIAFAVQRNNGVLYVLDYVEDIYIMVLSVLVSML